MAARLSRAGSSAVIEVADDQVERYTAEGWAEVKPKKAEPKSAPKKATKSDK